LINASLDGPSGGLGAAAGRGVPGRGVPVPGVPGRGVPGRGRVRPDGSKSARASPDGVDAIGTANAITRAKSREERKVR